MYVQNDSVLVFLVLAAGKSLRVKQVNFCPSLLGLKPRKIQKIIKNQKDIAGEKPFYLKVYHIYGY